MFSTLAAKLPESISSKLCWEGLKSAVHVGNAFDSSSEIESLGRSKGWDTQGVERLKEL